MTDTTPPLATAEALAACPWRTVLENVDYDNPISLRSAFLEASNSAASKGEDEHAAAHELLGQISGLMLNRTQQLQPFSPVVWFQNTEFPLARMISTKQARELGTFSQTVDIPWFKGHIAHLAWLAGGRNGIALALTAIDCYSATIADPTAEHLAEGTRWNQAIVLSKRFGSGAGNRLAEIEVALVNRILSSFPDNATGIHWLSKLLLKHDLGHAHAGQIAEHFCTWATHLGLYDDNIGSRRPLRECPPLVSASIRSGRRSSCASCAGDLVRKRRGRPYRVRPTRALAGRLVRRRHSHPDAKQPIENATAVEWHGCSGCAASKETHRGTEERSR